MLKNPNTRATVVEGFLYRMLNVTDNISFSSWGKVLSSEITLFLRGTYVKCQTFARQRTEHPEFYVQLVKNTRGKLKTV